MSNQSLKSLVISAFALISLHVSAQTDSIPVLDLTLDKAVEIALAENPTMRVADKDIELKKIADTEAWQSLLPTVTGSFALQNSIKVAAIKTPDGEFKMGVDGATTGIAGITATMPIFAPAVYQNMKLTKEDIQLAQEKARSSRLDLVNQVTKAYYAALLAKDSRDLMQRSYKVSKDNFDLVENKFKVGKVSEYDKITAEVQMRNMKSSVVSAETGLNLALLKLKVLMGINTDFNITIADSLKAHEGDITLANTQVGVEEIANNSSLRQLDMNRTLLERTRKILQTNFLPTIGMQFVYQYTSYSNNNWNFFSYKYVPSSTLSISLSIPIFTASNWTKLQSNRVQLNQLADTRENTQRQLSMAAESYRQNMMSTIAEIESDREAIKQADKAVSISSKRYEVGRGTILELNQSETALVQAELTYHQGVYNFLTNKADLDYTLGRE